MRRSRTTVIAILLAVPLVPGLASCSAGGGDDGGVSVSDAWVKAADGGMTGVFGTVVNDTGEDVLLVSGSSPAAARVELHTTATGDGGSLVMPPVEDGFEVPAHGTHALEPGADVVAPMGR